MNNFTENFFSKHKQWLDRNREYLENSNWHDKQVIHEVEGDKSLYAVNKAQKKWQEDDVSNDKAIVKNIVSRVKYFVKNTPGEKHMSRNKYIVKYMVDIIELFTNKCNTYLEENSINNITNKKIKNLEIKFQDLVFNEKIGVEDSLEALGVYLEHEGVRVKFYKDDMAGLPMREPLTLLNTDVKLMTESLDIKWESKIISSNDMYINMKAKDIPKWNSKKNYFEQEKEVLQFWNEEYNKIKFGITLGGYFIHPWLYFHLNYFRTPIPQKDGSEPTVQPDLRDNEWFFAENLKNCINEENENYYKLAMLVYGTRRFAKALRDDQDLYYTDGSIRPIGKASVGDSIFGSNGNPTKIVGVYPQGKVDLYEVELGDGRKSICCDEHLWTVYDYQAKKYKVLPLKELINNGWAYERNRLIDKKEGVSTIYKYYLPINAPVEYKNDIDLPIDPYYLGLWLGDGTKRTASITTEDTEIKEYIKEYSNKLGLKTRIEVTKSNAVAIHTIGGNGVNNTLFNDIRSFKLNTQKHIPNVYKTAHVSDRISLLQGLMDTDGTINKGGSDISYCSSDKILADDVLELCRSLGIHSRIKKFTGNYKKKNGELNVYYKVIMYTQLPVFRLERKLKRIDSNNVNRKGKIERVAIVNIKKIKPDYATCIRVDNADKEFITNDYIVTHNSVIMASLAHWRTLTKFNSFGSIVGGNSSDLNSLTSKIKTSMLYIEKAFNLDIMKQDWLNGETTFGIKEDISNSIIFSSLIVQNLQAGAKSKTQSTAGLAPSVSIYDEIGKYSFLKPYLAALPSFKTPFGFKCVTVLAGTGGEADLSADAMEVLNNPTSYDLLAMDWDLLESKIDPEMITWKRRKFATFFPGQMAYEQGFVKQSKRFSDFLGISNTDLDKITIDVTDWENNEKYLKERVEEAKKMKSTKGKLLEQQRKVQYPIDPEDCFITLEGNPFPSAEAKLHKEHLIATGNTGKKVLLRLDPSSGEVVSDMAEHLSLAEFPHPGGYVDAPVMLYEDLPTSPPPYSLYVAGLDDYKHDDTDGDSVGSITIYKREWFDPWSLRIVASYHSRPNPRSKFDRQCYYLLKAFNAICFPENEDNNFKAYLDNKGETELYFAKGLDFASELNLNNNGKRVYGWGATDKNIQFGYSRIKKYTDQDITVVNEEGEEITILGVQRINDIGILEEIQNYTKDGNFDKLRSFMGALMYAHYLDSIFVYPNPPNTRKELTKEEVNKKNKKRRSPYRKTTGSPYRK